MSPRVFVTGTDVETHGSLGDSVSTRDRNPVSSRDFWSTRGSPTSYAWVPWFVGPR